MCSMVWLVLFDDINNWSMILYTPNAGSTQLSLTHPPFLVNAPFSLNVEPIKNVSWEPMLN